MGTNKRRHLASALLSQAKTKVNDGGWPVCSSPSNHYVPYQIQFCGDLCISDPGVVLAYGLAVEEVKTDGDFTHFTWVGTANLAAADKVVAAFAADRARRSEEERNAIAESLH